MIQDTEKRMDTLIDLLGSKQLQPSVLGPTSVVIKGLSTILTILGISFLEFIFLGICFLEFIL